jgi:hypothetical protein
MSGQSVFGGNLQISFSYFGLSLFIVGLILILLVSLIQKRQRAWMSFFLLSVAYLFLISGYVVQKDPELKWEGSDVAWNNYYAALETVKYGPRYIVATWNGRANPFEINGYSPESKRLARETISRLGIRWISGDRWNHDDLKVDPENNRAFMHPPLAPIIMAFWLKIFPFGHFSLLCFTIFLYLFSFSIIFGVLLRSHANINQYGVLFLSIITSPCAVLFIDPSAEQLTMLFAGLSVLILVRNDRNYFVKSFLAGVLICLAFYTKFIVSFYILFQSFIFLVLIKRISWRVFVGYTVGVFSVLFFFTIHGYYFWLTVLTGQAVAKVYAMNNPVTFIQAMLNFPYFGPGLLLIFVLMLLNVGYKGQIDGYKIVLYPLCLGVVAYFVITWRLATFNRYLMVFVLAFVPFLCHYTEQLKFTRNDLLIVPLVNVFLIMTIVYL